MTVDPPGNTEFDELTAELRSLGRAILPAGFDDTVATFADMMAAIDAMPQELKDDLANEAEAHDRDALRRFLLGDFPVIRPRVTLARHVCTHCRMSSHRPDDIVNRYCGACHHFCDDVPSEGPNP